MIHNVLSNFAASISDLKKHPMAIIESAGGEPVAILNRNQPVFYCVPAYIYEAMLEALDDLEISKIVKARAQEKEIEVDINDL